ncbi:glycosyltransferase [Brevibacterium linens]|uniref:glycosyltransferase n=1 Tax=Brevibacterium linens TaxID=1703 RepID=UPI003F8A3F69
MPGLYRPERHYLIRETLSTTAGGGMQAMLRRASAFADYYSTPVDFLTYGFQPNFSKVAEELYESGKMAAEVRVHNLWDSLSATALEASSELFPGWPEIGALAEPSGNAVPDGVMDSGLQRIIQHVEDSEIVESVDYRRNDQSRFVSHIRNGTAINAKSQVALLNPDQRILKSWPNVTEMFAWLLTKVLGRENAVIVVDHPAMANSIAKKGYLTPNSVLIKCYHSNHSEEKAGVGYGQLSKRHVDSLERADVFDANVFPSKGQIQAAGALIGETTDMWPIGNIVESAEGVAENEKHSPNVGVLASRLVRAKNVDHAIAAVRLVNEERGDGDMQTSLSIFGVGPDEERLERLIEESELYDQVKLRGYTSDIYNEFKKASFSILPTVQEAFGLSIVESMICGCIPIVYDVPYGPSEIITDGVDGFLVPYGDIQGLAECIAKLRTMKACDLDQMRQAARERAKAYRSQQIAEEWAHAIDTAYTRKAGRGKPKVSECFLELTGTYSDLRRTGDGEQSSILGVELSSDKRVTKRAITGVRAFLSFRGRQSNLRIRVPGSLRMKRRGFWRRRNSLVLRFELPLDELDKAPREIVDIFARINDATTVREFRLRAQGVDIGAIRLPPGLQAYKTKGGYLSLRKTPGSSSA